MVKALNGHPVEALDRALGLLVVLADAGPDGATLGRLAELAGINKSTAHRALATMRLRGFATQDVEGGAYRLGPAAYELGDRALDPHNLATALHPALVALSRTAEELVHLGVLSGDRVVYLDKVEPDRAIRVWSAIGQQVPAATTALGRALLAARNVPDEMLDGYLRSLPEGRHVTPERLRESVALARKYGYAVELGENEPDVACIGTAIMHGASAVAALSITALADRMTEQRQQRLVQQIVTEVAPLLPHELSLVPRLTSRRPYSTPSDARSGRGAKDTPTDP